MSARTPGERFWQRSLHQLPAMPPANGLEQPAAFKSFPGRLRHPLPPAPRIIGNLRSSFHAFRAGAPEAGPQAPRRLDPAGVSALLHHTCGIARQELGPRAEWPYHRMVPSARCLFPTELHCWIPSTDGLPGGIHVYDPAHHALVPVRRGDVFDALNDAVAADLDGATCVLALSSVFARTAFRYGSYAYRLCTQEAGLVAGNALLVAGSLGMQGQVHYQFQAEALERLLGVRWPDEGVMSVVAMYPWQGAGRRRVRLLRAPTGPDRIDLAPAAVVPPLDRRECADLIELDAAGRAPGGPALLSTRAEPPPPGDGGPDAELAETLRRRWSGSPTFAPVARSLPSAAINRIARYALDAHGSDVVAEGAAPPVDCYLWMVAVDGAEPGVYQLSGGLLWWHGPADTLAAALPTTNVDHRSANALVYLVVDAVAASDTLGDRSFRILHQEAGIVAQRICVAAATESLAARIHNGYPAGDVGRALGIAPGLEVVFQIVLGTARPGDQYRMPVQDPGGAGSLWPIR